MARLSFAAVAAVAAVAAAASTVAFADGGQGIGRAGTYQVQSSQATADGGQVVKTRAQVRAELVAAYSNGTLPALNRNTYPDRSMAGDAVAAQHERRARDAALAEQRNRQIVEYANGSTTQSGVDVR
nr:DUF4148 domain-containing protein [Caballeronia glathei]